MKHLGIDPGWDAGAAVLLTDRGDRALFALEWVLRKRKAGDVWAARVVREGGVMGEYALPDLASVGAVLANEQRFTCSSPLMVRGVQPYTLTIEGLFGSCEKIAFSAGIVAGMVLSDAENSAEIYDFRPTAHVWRKSVLRLSRTTKKDIAKKTALRLVPRMVHGLGDLCGSHHVCEAAAIARWGKTQWDYREVRK